jgi:hypothetical protein
LTPVANLPFDKAGQTRTTLAAHICRELPGGHCLTGFPHVCSKPCAPVPPQDKQVKWRVRVAVGISVTASGTAADASLHLEKAAEPFPESSGDNAVSRAQEPETTSMDMTTIDTPSPELQGFRQRGESLVA